jgi:hypothetical protein
MTVSAGRLEFHEFMAWQKRSDSEWGFGPTGTIDVFRRRSSHVAQTAVTRRIGSGV